MEEEVYLQRLRSIREKYGCQSGGQLAQRNQEVFYPLSQARGYEQKNRCNDMSFSSYSPYHKDKNASDFQRERGKTEARIEKRNVSIDRKRMERCERLTSALPIRQMSEAQLKRHDNFTNFIDDLDKRIDEKQKLINQKFKENENVMRKMEGFSQTEVIKGENRYKSSSKERREPPLQSKLNFNYASRNSFEKNGSIAKKYDYENAENNVSAKIQWNQSSVSKATNYSKLVRDSPKKLLLLSPGNEMMSRKLEGSARDGWNPSRLDSIQNRIQSILRQVNR